MFYFDSLYILIVTIPALVLSVSSSLLVRYWANKYANVPSTTQLNGMDVVQKLASRYQTNISISQTSGKLDDHYDPSNKNLALSGEVANKATVTSVAIAAHEMGHVRQDFGKSILLGLRSLFVPIVNIGTTFGYIIIMMGLLISLADLAWLGILLFSLSTLFSLLTLPIEIDASQKAIAMIRENNILENYQIGSAKKVLFGASLTYVAAAAGSILNLLYFVIRVQGISKRD